MLFELRMIRVSQAAQGTPLFWAAPPTHVHLHRRRSQDAEAWQRSAWQRHPIGGSASKPAPLNCGLLRPSPLSASSPQRIRPMADRTDSSCGEDGHAVASADGRGYEKDDSLIREIRAATAFATA